jgi:hypothetical protein
LACVLEHVEHEERLAERDRLAVAARRVDAQVTGGVVRVEDDPAAAAAERQRAGAE